VLIVIVVLNAAIAIAASKIARIVGSLANFVVSALTIYLAGRKSSWTVVQCGTALRPSEGAGYRNFTHTNGTAYGGADKSHKSSTLVWKS
jgi:hypothetical protein